MWLFLAGEGGLRGSSSLNDPEKVTQISVRPGFTSKHKLIQSQCNTTGSTEIKTLWSTLFLHYSNFVKSYTCVPLLHVSHFNARVASEN